jgi:hypothetical protein
MKKKSPFKPQNEASIQPAIHELERLYTALAPRYGNLTDMPMPRVVIQSRGRKKHSLGWFARERWKDTRDGEASPIHEITITAESLALPVVEIIDTLAHEMTHCGCYYAGIKDMGKDGRYHNHRFKERAELVGLIVEKDMRLGWSLTRLGPELEAFVSGLNVKEDVFAVFRLAEADKPKQPTKMKLWLCSCPEPVHVRCAVELSARCLVCEQLFIKADTAAEEAAV